MARFTLGQHEQARASPLADKSNHQGHHDCSTITSSLASSHIGKDSTTTKSTTTRNKSVSFEFDNDDSPTKDTTKDTADNTLTMTDEDAIAQQHQERYSPPITHPTRVRESFHHPNMIDGEGPMISMMGNPEWYYNCNNGRYGRRSSSNSSPGGSHHSLGGGGGSHRSHVSGGGGSHHSQRSQHTHNTLNETFESNSLSSVCVKPCEGVGRIVGKTINGFLDGCTSVLDNYENLCSCPLNGPWSSDAKIGDDKGRGLVLDTTNRLTVENMMSSNGDWANTPHPITPLNGSGISGSGSGSGGGDLTEKMDELLKLLKDKESGPTPATTVAGSSLSKEETMVEAREDRNTPRGGEAGGDDDNAAADGAAIVAKAAAEEEESDKFPTIIEEDDDDAVDRANSLIGMFKNMNLVSNRFSRLDESAISKYSEVSLGIGGIGNDLLLDPTVETSVSMTKASSTSTTSTDNTTDASDDVNTDADPRTPGTKALMDELSFDFNHKGLSISGELDPGDEDKVAALATATATALGTTSGRPPLPVVVTPLSKKEKENNVKRSFSAPMDSSITKASSTCASASATSTTAKPSKVQQGKLRRGQRVKKMLKDIKNVPLKSRGLDINGKNKNSLSPFRSIKTKSRAVNITVEDRRNDSSERIVFNNNRNNNSNNINKHNSNNGNSDSRREQPFVANVSSTEMTNVAGIDPMGFPLSSKSKLKSKSKDIKKMNSWESSFTNKDNPFAATTTAVVVADKQQQQTQRIVNPTTPKAANKKKNINATEKTLTTQMTKTKTTTTASVSEIRICAWCRKGGLTNPEIIKKLKLCSQCQVTYYCSPECQSKDWINGHAKTCQPASVAMY